MGGWKDNLKDTLRQGTEQAAPLLRQLWRLLTAALGQLRYWVGHIPRWMRALAAGMLLYLAAFLVVEKWIRPPQYSWPARIGRYVFWPARMVEGLIADKTPPTDLSILKVPALQVQLEDITPRISSVGTIEHFEKVEVNAKSPGRIEQFFAREGDLVRKGQKIVQLEKAFLELDLRQQQAAYEAAKSELNLVMEKYLNARKAANAKFKEIEKQETLVKKLRADLDRARNTYAGKEILVSEGGISKEEFAEMKTEVIGKEAAFRMAQRDLDIISTGYREEDIKSKGLAVPADADARKTLLIDLNTGADKAEVEVARSRVKSADAAMQTTIALLRESTIVSPITGVIASRNKAVGEQVTGGSVATPSQAIMVVVDIRKVYAVMTIKESDLQSVRKGMPMVFTADPYSNIEFRGVVEIINPVIDPKTHTIEVKALLENPGDKLRPGMFIRSSIVSGKPERMIALPQTCIVPTEENKGYVFVIRAGEAMKVPVETGRQIEERIEIKKGLQPGDIVALDKISQLREGMKVTAETGQKPE